MKVCATFRYRIFMVVCKLYFVGSRASPTVVVRIRYRATAVTVVIELDVLAVLGEHSQRALVTLDLSGHELEFRHGVEQLRQVSVNNQRFKNQPTIDVSTINILTIDVTTVNIPKIKISIIIEVLIIKISTIKTSTINISTTNSQRFNNQQLTFLQSTVNV